MRVSESPSSLVAAYPAALRNKDLMRGWKRALTVYCGRKAKETGSPPFRFRAAIKMRLTKNGLALAA